MLDRLRKLFGLGATVGERGERIAARWLERERGFQIVARNWRSPRDRRDEIDLVARDGQALVFIEVKTRGPAALVPGFHAVDDRKKAVLRRAAENYLAALRVKPQTVRCDVVEVELAEDQPSRAAVVRHFENVELFAKHFRP